MKTLNFEAIKVALKQDKTGYVLTLSMHPDDIPEELLRDFVGARYQVVMVRVNEHEQPLDRQAEYEGDRAVRIAGLLCRDPAFAEFLVDTGNMFQASINEAATWLRDELGLDSRAELKANHEARLRLDTIYKEFVAWKQERS